MLCDKRDQNLLKKTLRERTWMSRAQEGGRQRPNLGGDGQGALSGGNKLVCQVVHPDTWSGP